MKLDAKMIATDVALIRKQAPLVHNITNYVVMNNTANALLALGASPVMAHAVEEMEDMVGLASQIGGALVINIGTLSARWIEAMESAMRAAQARGLAIVFDPVGAGATPYRTETCLHLLQAVPPAIIRGNASEIMALVNADIKTKGVDSSASTDAARDAARLMASTYGSVVSVSGEIDLITDGQSEIEVHQGHPLMPRVTGLGCTASALTGAFAAVQTDMRKAAAHAMAVMGIAGEVAAQRAQGPGSLQLHFLDALYQIDEAVLTEHLKQR